MNLHGPSFLPARLPTVWLHLPSALLCRCLNPHPAAQLLSVSFQDAGWFLAISNLLWQVGLELALPSHKGLVNRHPRRHSARAHGCLLPHMCTEPAVLTRNLKQACCPLVPPWQGHLDCGSPDDEPSVRRGNRGRPARHAGCAVLCCAVICCDAMPCCTALCYQ